MAVRKPHHTENTGRAWGQNVSVYAASNSTTEKMLLNKSHSCRSSPCRGLSSRGSEATRVWGRQRRTPGTRTASPALNALHNAAAERPSVQTLHRKTDKQRAWILCVAASAASGCWTEWRQRHTCHTCKASRRCVCGSEHAGWQGCWRSCHTLNTRRACGYCAHFSHVSAAERRWWRLSRTVHTGRVSHLCNKRNTESSIRWNQRVEH